MFANYKEAFVNKDIADLDRMAHLMNSNNSNCNNTTIEVPRSSVSPSSYEEYTEELTPVTKLSRQLNAPLNKPESSFTYFSTQGNLTSGINQADKFKYLANNTNVNFPNQYTSMMIKDLVKKELDEKKAADNSGEYIKKINTLVDIIADKNKTPKASSIFIDEKMEHIKNCDNCKMEFMRLLSSTDNNGHISIPSKTQEEEQIINTTTDTNRDDILDNIKKYFKNLDMSDVLVGVLIGLIVLFTLDILRKSKKL
jgi:hypothetical protein